MNTNDSSDSRTEVAVRNSHTFGSWTRFRNVRGLRFLGAMAFTVIGLASARAVDFHVATAQDLQNALTTAAANGAANNIWLASGYYTGNFNFNSAGGYNLLIANEPNVTNNSQITIDGAGTGRDMSLANTGNGNFTVQGITFLRNCGNAGIGALRIAGGGVSTILVQNCQFLSPTNTSGMGLELVSGLNASITNCVVIGSTTGGGGSGISVSGITGNVNVQSSAVKTNNNGGIGISGASVVVISGNAIVGNTWESGVYCIGTSIICVSNLFSGNSSYFAGGGILSCDTIVTLINNTFIGNSGSHGGGAYCTGTATLTGNTFISNSGDFGGGACFDGHFGFDGGLSGVLAAMLTCNTFTGNSASSIGGGGGVYCGCPTATLTNNTFTGNSSGASGGGAYCSGTVISFSGNTFTGNSSSSGGGGSYCSATTNILTRNVIEQNAAMTGGGLYVTGPTVTLQDNLVVNNAETSAGSQGGGVWMDATSNLFFINNTIFGNTATGSGGGAAFTVTGTVELLNVYNNIIWGNSANGNGADVWLAGTGQKKVFLNNDVNDMYGVWDIAQNLLNVDPQFFNAVGGDYHLQSASPCRNFGTNGAPYLPLTDLDGNLRTNSLGQVDFGCYEFNTTALHPADTNGDSYISAAEYAAYAAAWKAGQTWNSAPASAPNPNPISADYVTRAGYLLTNGTGHYTNDGSARPTNWKIAP